MFCQIKDKFEVYNELNICDKKCNSCGNNDHFVINCPLLNFRKNRELIIKTYIEKKDFQTRKSHDRLKKKINLTARFLQLQAISLKFCQENENQCEFNKYEFTQKFNNNFFL